MENPSTPDVAACIALAEAVFGRKEGRHYAAVALGISERTVRGIAYHEASGATVCPQRALEARLQLATLRTAQLRAELEHLEDISNAETLLAQRGPSLGAGV
jgi:hypothetical protein